MELRIMIEPQEGASYASQLAVAQTAERCGFDGFFRSDHLLAMDGDGWPGPSDSWVTLAGLARETSTIRLGTMVSSATFRSPGLLAIQVAQVDEMSGGRVELGLGAGWFEAEHAAYGIEFPGVGERFDRFAEQLQVITGLWQTPVGQRYSFTGDHYRLTDAPALPKPQQARVALIIGGMGRRRTPELTARFATEFNVPFTTPALAAVQLDRVRDACSREGRPVEELTLSAAVTAVVGADRAETDRRLAAIDRQPGPGVVSGSPAEVVDQLGAWAEVGVTRVYLQVLDLADLDLLELLAAEVLPQLDAHQPSGR